jgi:DNA replication licensing factor MCM3
MTDQIYSGSTRVYSHEEAREEINNFMNLDEVRNRIKHLINGPNRLSVSIDEVRARFPNLAKYIVKHPIESIKIFEENLNEAVKSEHQSMGGKANSEKVAAETDNFPQKTKTYYVNFEGNIGKNYVTPRGLKSHLVNQLVQVQGIVTKMSIVQPKIQKSFHYCEATKRGLVKTYNDKFNLAELDNEGGNDDNNAFPTKDAEGNPLSTEYGYCVYKDSQTVTIQELPENAPAG